MISNFIIALKIIDLNKLQFIVIVSISLFIALLELLGLGIFQSLLLSILSPEFNKQNVFFNFINKFFNLSSGAETQFLVLFFCVFFLLKNILTFIFNYLIFTLFQKFHQNVLQKYFNFLIGKKYNNSNEFNHVKQNQLLTRYIDNLVKMFTLSFFKIFNEIMIVSFILIFLIYSNFEIASISMLYLLIVSGSFIFFTSNKLKSNAKQISIAEEDMKKNIYEVVNNYKEIFAYKISKLFLKQFSHNSFLFTQAEKIYSVISSMSKQFFEITIVLLIGILFLFMNKTNDLMPSLAIIGTFGFALIKLIPSFNIIVGSITGIKQSSYAVNQIINFYDENLSSNDNSKLDELTTNTNKVHKITIKDLSFGYNKTKLIFENLNLDAKIGQLIGIQGPSGSGKTTFIDLILKLLVPQSGKITFFDNLGNEINNFNNFAYISQNVSIFNDTIANNISFNDKEIKKEQLNDILKMVDLGNLIDHKDIFKDKIELDGKDLSGGQKQKIAIARALYHDRQIILIDEATSNLDIESEKKFYKILRNIKKDKIIIFISHKIRDENIFDNIITIN